MREVRVNRPIQFLILGLVLAYTGILLFAPIAAIVGEAFSRGVAELVRALSNPDVALALRLTFITAAFAVLINTIAGVLLAWVLVRHRFPGRRFLDAMVDLPFVFSPVIIGYALIVLFGRNGWIRTDGFQIVFALPGILIATTFVTLPFVAREIQPVLAALAGEQEEAAFTLGAGRWLTFRRVILPQIWRALLYGVALTFARAIGDFGAVAVAGGGIERETETATLFLFRAFNDRNPAGAYGMAIVLCLLSVSTLVVMNLFRRGVRVKQ
jgi:sulfate/thiosulfate transport system permease protein